MLANHLNHQVPAQFSQRRSFGSPVRFLSHVTTSDSFEPKASKGVLPEDFIQVLHRSGLTLEQVLQQTFQVTRNEIPGGRDANFYTIPIPGFESFGLRFVRSSPQAVSPFFFSPFHSKVAGDPVIGTVLGHIGDTFEVLQRMPGQNALSFYLFPSRYQENQYVYELLDNLWLEHTGKSIEAFKRDQTTDKNITPEIEAILRKWDLESQAGYVEFTRRVAQFPQSAFDEVVRSIENARSKGLTFDFSQPKNIIIRPDNRFGLVDYSECRQGGEHGNTVNDFMMALFGVPRQKACLITNVKDPALQARVRESAHTILEKLQNACLKYHVKMVTPPGNLDLKLAAAKKGFDINAVLDTLRQASIDRYQGLETDATRFARDIVDDVYHNHFSQTPFMPLYSDYLDGPNGLFTVAHFVPDPRVVEYPSESWAERIRNIFS